MHDYFLGLTGNIAAGKSSIAKDFEALGVPHIDLDAICHDLYASDKSLVQEIVRYVGPVADGAGKMDMEKLREIVFSDLRAKAQFEAIVWPEVEEIAFSQARQIGGLVVMETPMLYEAGWQYKFHDIALVYCDDKIRKQRVIDRGFNQSSAAIVMNSQMNQDKKMELTKRWGGYIIDNSGDEQARMEQVSKIYESINQIN